MPLAVGITEGVAFGVVACAVLKRATGRGRGMHVLVYVRGGVPRPLRLPALML
jgi:xanthine/uracil/vitamin C permease (AzgA family)